VFFRAAAKDVKQQEKLFNNARDNYFSSLAKLKTDPTNADVKQETLRLGRNYSEQTRKRKGVGSTVTIYDEMALMNDIKCGMRGSKCRLVEIGKSVNGRATRKIVRFKEERFD